mmetsp:Transcript_18945/g.23318  ORF Transcript_18945/g.23318 Transcript_18945/m.23318 type:complete len:251 (+) Transcript_18945:994-1746(+)
MPKGWPMFKPFRPLSFFASSAAFVNSSSFFLPSAIVLFNSFTSPRKHTTSSCNSFKTSTVRSINSTRFFLFRALKLPPPDINRFLFLLLSPSFSSSSSYLFSLSSIDCIKAASASNCLFTSSLRCFSRFRFFSARCSLVPSSIVVGAFSLHPFSCSACPAYSSIVWWPCCCIRIFSGPCTCGAEFCCCSCCCAFIKATARAFSSSSAVRYWFLPATTTPAWKFDWAKASFTLFAADAESSAAMLGSMFTY